MALLFAFNRRLSGVQRSSENGGKKFRVSPVLN
jgi:hypothetical protein